MEAASFWKLEGAVCSEHFKSYIFEYILFILSLSDYKMFANLCSCSLFSKYAYIFSDHKTPSGC